MEIKVQFKLLCYKHIYVGHTTLNVVVMPVFSLTNLNCVKTAKSKFTITNCPAYNSGSVSSELQSID